MSWDEWDDDYKDFGPYYDWDDGDDDPYYDGDDDPYFYIPYDFPRITGLRSLVPSITYGKGQSYCRQGRVRMVSIDRESVGFSVSSYVQGTRLYSCKALVDGHGKVYYEDCDCPAHSNYSGPCKHIIATLLKINQKNGESDGGYGSSSYGGSSYGGGTSIYSKILSSSGTGSSGLSATQTPSSKTQTSSSKQTNGKPRRQVETDTPPGYVGVEYFEYDCNFIAMPHKRFSFEKLKAYAERYHGFIGNAESVFKQYDGKRVWRAVTARGEEAYVIRTGDSPLIIKKSWIADDNARANFEKKNDSPAASTQATKLAADPPPTPQPDNVVDQSSVNEPQVSDRNVDKSETSKTIDAMAIAEVFIWFIVPLICIAIALWCFVEVMTGDDIAYLAGTLLGWFAALLLLGFGRVKSDTWTAAISVTFWILVAGIILTGLICWIVG